jgi:hypothetical protein
LPRQGEAEASVGVGKAGFESDRRAIFGNGLVELALGEENVAEEPVGFGVVGLDPDRAPYFVLGLDMPARLRASLARLRSALSNP